MIFVFADKNKYETDIITKILLQEKIWFKIKERQIPVDYGDEEPCDYVSIFDICCYTDLIHYNFIKSIINKKINRIKQLDKMYYSKKIGKKNVPTRKKTSD